MEKKIRTYIIIIFFILLTFIQLRVYLLNADIKNYGKEIIVKFAKKDVLPKTTTFYFTYFINGKKIMTANSGIRYSILNSEDETQIIDNLKINNFYSAKYIPKHLDKIIVNPQKKITDTTAILQAGFTIEDIKK